jgi:CTP:molybdopterin cytidylyltransferase MocA
VTLVAAYHRTRAPVVRPVYRGRHGHPVVFARNIWPALKAAPAGEGARAVVRALGDAVCDIEVDDAGVTIDVDTPEDYRRLIAALEATGGTADPPSPALPGAGEPGSTR